MIMGVSAILILSYTAAMLPALHFMFEEEISTPLKYDV